MSNLYSDKTSKILFSVKELILDTTADVAILYNRAMIKYKDDSMSFIWHCVHSVVIHLSQFFSFIDFHSYI